MKKILFVLSVMLVSSCASLFEDRIVIKDYNEQMSLLKENYPEIYEQYKKGIVDIDKIYTYTDTNTGERHVKVKFHRSHTTVNYVIIETEK